VSAHDQPAGVAVFRADASVEIGGGHVHRCLSLAAALSQAGWRCLFAARPETAAVLDAFDGIGHGRIVLPAIDDVERLRRTLPEGCDLLVVDHYGLDADFETRCRGWARRIAVIDDLFDRRHDCDMLVNAAPGLAADAYRALVPQGCRVLMGSGFAMLADDFRRVRPAALRRRQEPVRRVLVSIGSADRFGITQRSLDAIGSLDAGLEVDVVLGASSPNLDAVRAMIADYRGTARLHVDTRDMARLMSEADIAVGAAGTTSWERCCLGLPSVAIAVADNQSLNIEVLTRSGAAVCFADSDGATTQAIADALRRLLERDDERRAMSAAAAALCDGWGAPRLRVALATSERAKDGAAVWLRACDYGDRDMMLDWQSSPGLRAFSRNPEPPSAEGHDRWLRGKLADGGCVLNIVMHGDAPAGVLRFDTLPGEDDAYEVSILIAPQRQNLGLGRAALRLGQSLLPGARVVAHVRPDNLASRRIFLSAGYADFGDRLIYDPAKSH
jgi:UDP-2,4-diacetamido-2,4,6-trideoxy-beta-L-altropyranose hydrolase